MNQERLQVLEMLQEGKITAEEAAALLEAMEPASPKPVTPKGDAQWLRIRVTDSKSGKNKVNVNFPISLISIATKFVKPEQIHGVDLNEVIAAIKEGAKGRIVDVVDEDEGTQVEIVIE